MALGHSPQIVRDGLVLHLDAANVKSYPGSGESIKDLSIGNDSVMVNGTGFVEDNLGAFVFDGSNDYIDILNTNSYQLFNTDRVTVSVWFNAQLFSGRKYIFENRSTNTNNPFPLFVDSINQSSGNLRLYVNRDQTIKTINTDTFYNVTYSIDSTSSNDNLKVYINYDEQYIYSVSYSSLANTSSNMFLGRAYPSSGYRFYGKIYNFMLYNKILSDFEVKQTFEAYRDRYGI